MSDLAAFLLARIAEDEEIARAATPGPWNFTVDEWTDGSLWAGNDSANGIAHASWEHGESTVADFTHIARHDPARVLAECAAKRQIVEQVTEIRREAGVGVRGDSIFLRILALPYADHPDFRDEWQA